MNGDQQTCRQQFVSDQAALLASESGNLEVVQRWLHQGEYREDFNINILGGRNQRYTALIYAANEGHDAIVQVLIHAGADISYRPFVYDALDRSIICHHNVVAMSLLDAFEKQGVSPNEDHLFWAVRLQMPTVLERLLKWPLDIDQIKDDSTLEWTAEKHGYVEILDVLRSERARRVLDADEDKSSMPDNMPAHY